MLCCCQRQSSVVTSADDAVTVTVTSGSLSAHSAAVIDCLMVCVIITAGLLVLSVTPGR